MNIALFTDNLSRISGIDYNLSDYTVSGNSYRLIISGGGNTLLLTAEEKENKKIQRLRLTLSKIDESGNKKALSDSEALFFTESALNALMAYTYFEKEKCDEILSLLLPACAADLEKTGENKYQTDNYTLILYSNQIACQLMISCDYLYKYETTEKPVSKPLFDGTNTAVNP